VQSEFIHKKTSADSLSLFLCESWLEARKALTKEKRAQFDRDANWWFEQVFLIAFQVSCGQRTVSKQLSDSVLPDQFERPNWPSCSFTSFVTLNSTKLVRKQLLFAKRSSGQEVKVVYTFDPIE
jgi:hypothetical protein